MAENSLSASLFVTLIGMGVVFLAMSFFYLSMQVLTRWARDRSEAPAAADDGALQAAAIAVALARSERLEAGEIEAEAFESLNPWRDFYRQRQLWSGFRERMG
jgi:Na+-transporting methylmalonyl-CoA/oxaloacetate decarboxylase gamma subunit